MKIKKWNCQMWGMRRLDTRMAIDAGKFTLYMGGFSFKDISSPLAIK